MGHTSQSRMITIHKVPKQCSKPERYPLCQYQFPQYCLSDPFQSFLFVTIPSCTSLSPASLTAFLSQQQTNMSQLTPKNPLSYELPDPPPPQPTPSLPRWRALLLDTAHQQGSEFSRLPQMHLKEAQLHFSWVHWFHCFPPVAQLFGYENFRQFSGFLLRLSQHTEFVWQSKPNLTLKAHWLHSSS